MKRTAVIDLVALSMDLMGEHMPFLKQWSQDKSVRPIKAVLPAVTTSIQSTYLTGKWPQDHGIVGNGWYHREEAEVKFWKQSNHLVQGEKVWESLQEKYPGFTCAKLFWWYNMYSAADYSVTPRPMYPADGRKLPDIYTQPSSLRKELQDELGTFPLFNFWGPTASIRSSQWISEAAQLVEKKHSPHLHLIYLPHLDYPLQKFGRDMEKIGPELRAIDQVLKPLISYLEFRGVSVMLLSEYGIDDVKSAIHLNRIFRTKGWLSLREELGRELLDPGSSAVFAVADHQVAHVYVKDPSYLKPAQKVMESIQGIEHVLEMEGKQKHHLNHERAGDLVGVADRDHWFSYYYWLDDAKAPDFARTVDIHRKPGYDPVEMFTDPQQRLLALKIGWKLMKKKLGFRTLMDFIPLDTTLVKGSHGRIPESLEKGAMIIHAKELDEGTGPIEANEVKNLMELSFE